MKLQDFIQKTGITVNKLAERCGVSHHHVRHILREKSPSLKTAVAISKYTEGLVSVEELLPSKFMDELCTKGEIKGSIE